MTRIERLLIICLLVSRSMEVDKTVEFVDVIESGCLAHEQDSIQYKNNLVAAAKTAPIDDKYGPILMLLLQAHQIESTMELLQKHENHLDKILTALQQPAQNRIAEKVLIKKLSDFVKFHPSTEQVA
ncbi:hypothetical protein [Mesorhizobium sp. SP-1A]|uniref:hypothetical protein n=1 Tax=Mesorhizobium sp. SP-1A TaxID=3077840 RepID=UPI0028F72710|nr:hypothetical protein [Mesorhizobium sp. SP-1A]